MPLIGSEPDAGVEVAEGVSVALAWVEVGIAVELPPITLTAVEVRFGVAAIVVAVAVAGVPGVRVTVAVPGTGVVGPGAGCCEDSIQTNATTRIMLPSRAAPPAAHSNVLLDAGGG